MQRKPVPITRSGGVTPKRANAGDAVGNSGKKKKAGLGRPLVEMVFFADLGKEGFFDRCFENEMFLHSKSTSQALTETVSSLREEINKVLDAGHLLWNKDVQEIEVAADGIVHVKEPYDQTAASAGRRQAFKSPATTPNSPLTSHHVLNLDLYARSVGRLVMGLDAMWMSHGGVSTKLVRHRSVPGPAYSHTLDYFLLQIEGAQRVKLYKISPGTGFDLVSEMHRAGSHAALSGFYHASLNAKAADVGLPPVFTNFDSGFHRDHLFFSLNHLNDLVKTKKVQVCLETVLHAGQSLYVPAGYVLWRETAEEKDVISMDISFYLPPQPSWVDYLNDVLSLTQTELQLGLEDVKIGASQLTGSHLAKFSGLHADRGEKKLRTLLDDSMIRVKNIKTLEAEEAAIQAEHDAQIKPSFSPLARFRHDLNLILEQARGYQEHVAGEYEQMTKYTRALIADSGAAYRAVREKTQNLPSLLKRKGGLIKIRNFLPDQVAQTLADLLEGVPEDAWNETRAEANPAAHEIAHHFESSKLFPCRDAVFDLIQAICPQLKSSFSFASYTDGHFIEAHRDMAYKTFDGLEYSRKYALVLYLSRDWLPENGGAFLDCEDSALAPAPIVPEFNTCLIFSVPRLHAVEPVKNGARRQSLFGWFYEPGRLYDLNDASNS